LYFNYSGKSDDDENEEEDGRTFIKTEELLEQKSFPLKINSKVHFPLCNVHFRGKSSSGKPIIVLQHN